MRARHMVNACRMDETGARVLSGLADVRPSFSPRWIRFAVIPVEGKAGRSNVTAIESPALWFQRAF